MESECADVLLGWHTRSFEEVERITVIDSVVHPFAVGEEESCVAEVRMRNHFRKLLIRVDLLPVPAMVARDMQLVFVCKHHDSLINAVVTRLSFEIEVVCILGRDDLWLFCARFAIGNGRRPRDIRAGALNLAVEILAAFADACVSGDESPSGWSHIFIAGLSAFASRGCQRDSW